MDEAINLPLVWRYVVDNENPVVVFAGVVHHRINTRADALASFVFVALCLKKYYSYLCFSQTSLICGNSHSPPLRTECTQARVMEAP